MSIVEALYKLEASRDIPAVKLITFDGNPLHYVEFMECFKIHIHSKPHLSDDMRIVQLRMHVKGDAERCILGLGSQGIMYASALKTLKEQFGQQSVIARAYIKMLVNEEEIPKNDKHALRDLSLDIISCLATLRQIGYYADMNANENLRKIIARLPGYLIEKWKHTVTKIRDRNEIPTLQHISDFIRERVKMEYDPDFGDIRKAKDCDSQEIKERDAKGKLKGIHSTSLEQRKQKKCYICAEEHKIQDCPTFVDSTIDERFAHVKTMRLCFSCLTKGHMTKDCRSKRRCGKDNCPRLHHQLIHTDPPVAGSLTSALDCVGILPVVRVQFKSANGKVREGNVLIDSGAGTTVIRKEFAKALGLQGKGERINLAVVGGDRIERSNSRRLKFWISSLHEAEEYAIEAHELDKTIINVPALNRQWLKSFPHLADIEFTHKAGPIDLILGVQYSHLHAEEDIRQGLPFEPVGKRTKLGWLVIGSDTTKKLADICSVSFIRKLDLEKFYSFETLGIQASDCSCPKTIMTMEERKTMELFRESCVKREDRYVIGLPWKKNPSLLPDNYSLAERRLISLERSLMKDASRAKLYDEAMMEYEKNNWARKLTKEELNSDIKPIYYLPHHGVYRPEKRSTPLRIVFDPACKYEGVSLNSFLHKGPCLIGNLLGILLRFREDHFAFTGDIAKMFLQICLSEQDIHVHRFLWRNLDPAKEPDVYALLRVTFGDKPSPDMASFVMLRIAEENEREFPNAAAILRRDRYMDDLIHSCATAEEAFEKMRELEQALGKGSFQIKEWHCSSDEVIPNADRKAMLQNANAAIHLDGETDVKTLGIKWNPHTDTINFSIQETTFEKYTKRNILSRVSTLYDPLGLATAVTIKLRMALQDIWRATRFGWDDCLPKEACQLWHNLFKDIETLKTVEFPRCLKPDHAYGLSELHVFCDASLKAYGAVAYLMWHTKTGIEVRLVSAKARVAPLRQSSIPRLELMAALIAARLAKTICDEFKNMPSKVTLWSDSKIVLNWLLSESTAYKIFVGIRIAEIQTLWDSSHWRYVPTNLNPADELSKGISVEKMTKQWMNGPPFLRKPQCEWPVYETVDTSEDKIERKNVSYMCAIAPTQAIRTEDYSNWTKLLRVTAFCFRFIKNCKQKMKSSAETLNGSLSLEELEMAERFWICDAQKGMHKPMECYDNLAPFVEDDIIRVGGRLKRAPLTYDQIHPILLPGNHNISKLIMKDIHERVAHAGSERTLCESRQKFWIIRGRNVAKSIVRSCVICKKLRQPAHTTLMADLPPERAKLFSPPFSVTGVDLFGPFYLKCHRSAPMKSWGALFTCATVRAIHLEIVENLSTQAFLQALRRFAAHHGWPQTIISDNGRSFVGAEKELRNLVREGRKQIEDFAVLHKVKWIFTTPFSPHQGGIYESLIKQTKGALRVVVGSQILSFNEMSTIFAEVECLINSRPIAYGSNDPNDLRPLTPNHFILGRASPEIPQGPFKDTSNLRKRAEYTQTLLNQFWKRFIREYFVTLTRRSKWKLRGRQMAVGDIVLLTDPNIPRGKWDLARVVEVYPGSDGIVRNVKVRTKKGEFQRAVQKCCPIIDSNDKTS